MKFCTDTRGKCTRLEQSLEDSSHLYWGTGSRENIQKSSQKNLSISQTKNLYMSGYSGARLQFQDLGSRTRITSWRPAWATQAVSKQTPTEGCEVTQW
jgi:hypothetical protein